MEGVEEKSDTIQFHDYSLRKLRIFERFEPSKNQLWTSPKMSITDLTNKRHCHWSTFGVGPDLALNIHLFLVCIMFVFHIFPKRCYKNVPFDQNPDDQIKVGLLKYLCTL